MAYNNYNQNRNNNGGGYKGNRPYNNNNKFGNRNGGNRNRNRRHQQNVPIKRESEETVLYGDITARLEWRDSVEEFSIYLQFHNHDLTRFYEIPAVQASRELKEKLFKILDSKDFAKAVKNSAKSQFLDDGWIALANDFIVDYASKQPWFNAEDPAEDKRIKHYISVVEIVGGKLAQSISDAIGLPKDLILDILTIIPKVPTPEEIKYKIYKMLKAIDLYVGGLEEEDYLAAEFSIKKFRKLFKTIFDKEDRAEVALRILLQREKSEREKENVFVKEVDTMITAVALSILDDCEKEEIINVLYQYIDIRKREEHNKQVNRRAYLLEVPQYENVTEAVNRVIQQRKDAEDYLN